MGLTYYCFKEGVRVFSLKNTDLGSLIGNIKMWKFEDFSASQILCEINFGDFEA